MSAKPYNPVSAPARSTTRLFSRDGFLCVAVFLVCLMLAWPFAEIGVNDDWSYVLTAWGFARTGHLIYNGGSTAMLGWQPILGGLAARLFGESFTAVRLSLLPIHIGTVLLFHAILRRFGLNRVHAIFGTLTFVLGPLFVSLAGGFMSDLPGVFALLVCLYLCQLAVSDSNDRMTIVWLVSAAATNVGLGTVRQIAWLGVLVMVPSCGWLLRGRRSVLKATAACWLLSVIAIAALLYWFNLQPYILPEKLIPGKIGLVPIRNLIRNVWKAAFTVLLLCLPVLAAGLPFLKSRGKLATKVLQIVGSLALVAAIAASPGASMKFLPPWLGNILTSNGLAQGGSLIAMTPIPKIALLLLSAFLLVCMIAFANAFRSTNTAASSGVKLISKRHETNVLLLPFLIAYGLLLFPRSAFSALYDRYLFLPIALALVYLLRQHQQWISASIAWTAYAVLGLSTTFSVASTHDLFAMERARVRLLNEVQAAGVPRTSIRGDFEFDAETEVRARGYVNDPRIVNPKQAYEPTSAETGANLCSYWFDSYAPAIHARYAITSFPSLSCFGPSPFHPVNYRTWLPPGSRQLFAGSVTH